MYLNTISKFVYYLISFLPILILGLSYYLTKVCWLYLKYDYIYVFIFIFIFLVLFLVVKKIIKVVINKLIVKLQLESIIIEEIEICDFKSISVFFSYVFPIISWLLGEFEKVHLGINHINALLVYCFLFSGFLCMNNNIQPNSMLVLCGYHFYKIKIKNGVKDYLLISKNDIQSMNQLTKVRRCFSYACIDFRK